MGNEKRQQNSEDHTSEPASNLPVTLLFRHHPEHLKKTFLR